MKLIITLQGKRLLVLRGILENERACQAAPVSGGESFYDVFIVPKKGKV